MTWRSAGMDEVLITAVPMLPFKHVETARGLEGDSSRRAALSVSADCFGGLATS